MSPLGVDMNVVWAKERGLETPYPLLGHLLDTSAVMGELYHRWLRPGLRSLLVDELGEHVDKLLMLVAGLHDIGKANPHFQQQNKQQGETFTAIRENLRRHGLTVSPDYMSYFSETRAMRRHENHSAIILDEDIETDMDAADSWLALALVGHHGKFAAFNPTRATDLKITKIKQIFDTTPWGKIHKALIAQVELGVGMSRDELPDHVSPTVTVLISGLVVLADRIASQLDWTQTAQREMDEGIISLADPKQWVTHRAAESVEIIKKTVGLYQNWSTREAARADILDGFPPRFAQAAALEQGDGLWNVMAATGSGKTEAALLRHATRNERLIFLLPTQATTNAIMRRVQKAFKGTTNVASLAHGLAITEDFYSQNISVSDVMVGDNYQDNGGLFPTEFVKSGASRLLAPVCVGTVDQAILGSLPTKFNHLRLLALANAHVVIDEVHTLDAYQSELLEDLLHWWAATHTPITFLTATMPAWQQEKFKQAYSKHDSDPARFPSFTTWLPRSGDEIDSAPAVDAPPVVIPTEPYTIDLTVDPVPYDQLVDSHIRWIQAQRQAYPQARIGIICNTVDRAQAIVQAFDHEKPVLLHSRMTAEHRRRNAEELEQSIGKNGEATTVLVVGTQAIEASLDIDLDALRTELCPAESLIQRAGRLWRRDDVARADRVPGLAHKTISIAAIDNPKEWQTKPYFAAQLDRVAHWIAALDEVDGKKPLRFPDQIQDFINQSSMGLTELFTTLNDDEDDNASGMDEIAELIHKINAGNNARIDFSTVLADDATNTDFFTITHKDELAETATRLIDRITIPAILHDPTGTIPGAWTGSIADLNSIKWHDTEAIREALRAVVEIPDTSSYKAMTSEATDITSNSSILCRYKVVENANRFYDQRLGLIPIKES